MTQKKNTWFSDEDGSKETIAVNHTYNAQQIEWFKAGGALNLIRKGIGA